MAVSLNSAGCVVVPFAGCPPPEDVHCCPQNRLLQLLIQEPTLSFRGLFTRWAVYLGSLPPAFKEYLLVQSHRPSSAISFACPATMEAVRITSRPKGIWRRFRTHLCLGSLVPVAQYEAEGHIALHRCCVGLGLLEGQDTA
jgi:hypothetical protein